MRRWNDYYDSMDPKNKAKINPMQRSAEPKLSSATMKYLSFFPRKVSINSRNLTPSTILRDSNVGATAETNFQPGRYTSRNNDIATIDPPPSMNQNNKSDVGPTNYAWVD